MQATKTTFALFFGNRGFFPSSLIKAAREEMSGALHAMGHKTLMLDGKVTPGGAVETPEQGEIYADFLCKNHGKFGGIILCLPNFGDENGAAAALKEAGLPILIQAYPDELDKMGPDQRRDAFCGKLSIMDVFYQHGIPFTHLKPHTVHPESRSFQENVDTFDRICRIVGGLKGMVVGAVGARTTPFKTVRTDEIALQRHGITVETIDLSEVFGRMESLDMKSKDCRGKRSRLMETANWEGVPEEALNNLVRLAVVLDQVIDEYRMDALALRCWQELQLRYGISPCVLSGELSERGVPVACEVDVGNAVTMTALRLASGSAPGILDWNNNYRDDENKCVLFHCGNVPPSLMRGMGMVSDHSILANSIGAGKGFGCNVGRIAPTPFTFGSMTTRKGRLHFYIGQGRFTEDPLPENFFGCAGVAEISNLQDVLRYIGRTGHRHHVSVTAGEVAEPLMEAFQVYLGFEADRV